MFEEGLKRPLPEGEGNEKDNFANFANYPSHFLLLLGVKKIVGQIMELQKIKGDGDGERQYLKSRRRKTEKE